MSSSGLSNGNRIIKRLWRLNRNIMQKIIIKLMMDLKNGVFQIRRNRSWNSRMRRRRNNIIKGKGRSTRQRNRIFNRWSGIRNGSFVRKNRFMKGDIPCNEDRMRRQIKNFISFDIKWITKEDTPSRPRIKLSSGCCNSGCKTLTTKDP